MFCAEQRARALRIAGRLMLAGLAAILVTTIVAKSARADGHIPVQVYFVPFPEDQALVAMQTLYPSAAECGGNSRSAAYPVTSYLTISAVSSGTIIIYDHWEDGYEVDMSTPTQSSTEIWGDGDLENGWLPDHPTDYLNGGVIVLESLISKRQVLNNQALNYSGGDRIGANGNVAVTRAIWATGPDTLMAGAVAMVPLRHWGTRYVLPVGQDAYLHSQTNEPLSLTAASVMASQDATAVTVDVDADGTPDSETILQQGESFYVSDLAVGAIIEASSPIEVTVVTGDRCDNYESRWYSLYPEKLWSDSYYNPIGRAPDTVDGPTETTVYLHNPSISKPITVNVEAQGGALPPIHVPVTSTTSFTMPVDAGVHFYTSDGSLFQALAAVDASGGLGKDADWGMSIIPQGMLTSQALVGLGIGRDSTSSANPDENGSPVWVMPVYGEGVTGPVQICVDFNGDNKPGLPDGNGYYYDLLLDLEEFENARVYDPDGDQSAMLLYACDPTTGHPPDIHISTAWGQFPGDASLARPGLDMGTAVPPLPLIAAGKAAVVATDHNLDGVVNPGDSVEYSVTVRNSSRITVSGIHISDTIPLNTEYRTNSTSLDVGVGPSPYADDAVGTPFPLDEGGIDLGDLATSNAITISYQVNVDDPFLAGEEPITNTASVTGPDETYEVALATGVYYADLVLQHTASHDFVAAAGTIVTHTYAVTNTGLDPLTNVVLADDGCAPLFLNGGDANANGALNIHETWHYTCTVPVLGPITNTMTATMMDPLSRVITRTAAVFIDTGFKWVVPILRQANTPCPAPFGCFLTGEIMGMDINATTNELFITSRQAEGGESPDQLLKLDAYTAEILGRVETGAGSDPWGVVVNPKTGRVYVGLEGTAEVVVYDGASLEELARLYIDNTIADSETALPGRMAILPELNTVFVTVRGDDRIAIIKGLDLVASVEAGGSGPWGIATDDQQNLVYVSHRLSRNFSILQRDDGNWIAKPGPAFPDAREFTEMDYVGPSDTNQYGILYTLWANPHSSWFVGLWQPGAITTEWTYRGDVVLNSHGDLDTQYAGGDGLAVNPSTGNIYTANTGDDALTVIRGDGSEYLDFIRVQDDPFPIIVNPMDSIVYVGLRAPGALVTILDEEYP